MAQESRLIPSQDHFNAAQSPPLFGSARKLSDNQQGSLCPQRPNGSPSPGGEGRGEGGSSFTLYFLRQHYPTVILRLLPLLLIFLASCRSMPDPDALTRFEFNEPHMGTLFGITLYAPNQLAARTTADAAFRRIAELDRTMPEYDPRSELMQLTLRPVGEPTRVSPELFAILQESQRVSRETG